MRAIVAAGPGDSRIVEEPEPELADGTVKVRVRYCSVVMENVGLHLGTDPRLREAGNPLYQGYPLHQAGELVGEVVEVAPGVRCVAEGDRLVSYASYQEVHVVPPDSWTRVPAGVPVEAAISHPFAGTTLHATRRARLTIGDDVLVIGAGPLGVQLAAWSRFAGAGRVISADRYPFRLDVARRMGATHTVDAGRTSLTDEVTRITEGRGPDVVFDAGNTAATFPLALSQTRQQGRLVVLSWHTQPITIEDITRDFYHKEVEIIATRAGGPGGAPTPYVRWTSGESQRLIGRLMADGRFDPAPLITDRRPVEEFVAAMDTLRQEPATHLKALVAW